MTSSRQTAGSQHTAAASSRSPCPADDSRKFIRLETTMHHSPYVATSPQQQALVRLAVYALHLGAPQSAACRLSSLYPVESPPHVGGCGSASRTARIAGCRWTGVHSRMGLPRTTTLAPGQGHCHPFPHGVGRVHVLHVSVYRS